MQLTGIHIQSTLIGENLRSAINLFVTIMLNCTDVKYFKNFVVVYASDP